MTSPDAVFRALADPSRREMLRLLRNGSLTSGEIAAKFSTAWATTSRHLGVLREAGLVIAERDGSSIRYELNTTVLQEVVRGLLDHVQLGGDNV
jgi:DNA-binding transcriptional ArsR family regulator